MKLQTWSLCAAIGCLSLLCAWGLPTAQARFARVDLEKIPVDRLVANLRELSEKSPKDAQILYNLARVYAMAYATKKDECEVRKGRIQDGVWFGYTPSTVPFKANEVKDDKVLKAAGENLAKAIETYEQVLKLRPDDLAAQLGLAWSQEQKGDKKAAVEGYRKVIEKGWDREKNLKNGPLGANYITAEAVGYLVPLLDAKADVQEIATLKERVSQLQKLPYPRTPIVIPLQNGLTAQDVENRRARVKFDMDGSGLAQERTWITPQAGWLVYAPRGQEKITSGRQMFGNVSFWLFWEHGYQALQTLDDNGDGQLTGAELKDLAIWCDKNGDGICDPGEVQPLSAYGIVALSCRGQQDSSHPDQIWYAPKGVTFADGSTRPTYDVVLHPAGAK